MLIHRMLSGHGEVVLIILAIAIVLGLVYVEWRRRKQTRGGRGE